MAGQTLSGFDAVLKDFYLPPIIDSLPQMVELYDEFKKDTQSWEGRKVIQPIKVGRNVGTGSRGATGNLPTAGGQGYQDHLVYEKYNYARIQVTEPTIKASAGNVGAFTKVVASEVEGAAMDLTKDLDRQFWGDGLNVIGKITTGATGTSWAIDYAGAASGPVSGEPGTRYLNPDMGIAVGTLAEMAAATCEYTTVSSITNLYTMVTPSKTFVTGDLISPAASAAVADNSYGAGVEGLDSAFPSSGSYQNISMDNYKSWRSNVYTNPAGAGTNRTLDETLLQQAIDDCWNNGSCKIDKLYMHSSMRAEVQNLFRGDKRYTSPVNIDVGNTGSLSFNGIPILLGTQCQYNRIYGLTRSTWTLYVKGDMFWMDADGAILSRVSGVPAYEASLCYFSNLGCDKPAGNFVIKDLACTLKAA
jgi:hypothetical protein